MIAGLTSTGVTSPTCASLPAAVGRHLLKTQGYDAGFHVGVSITDPEVVQIRFFEQPGIQLTPQMQKEVEKHFTRHELRRAAFGAVGDIEYPARVRESYAQDLLAALDVDSDARAAASGSWSTTAARRPRSCCRSCSARSASRRSARTSSPPTAPDERRPRCANRSARRSGS